MSPRDLELALAGDRRALHAFVLAMTPVVKARVVRVLMRKRGYASGRDIGQEHADMCQEVFISLFSNGGAMLRAWDASRGLSLENFVGLVAERQVLSILRTGKRSPWTEDPTLCETMECHLERPNGPAAVDVAVAASELYDLVVERLVEKLSPLGLELFRRLFIEEADIEEVRRVHGMTVDAVYAWRSRLIKLARGIRDELMSEIPITSRNSPIQ
ncbi:MAG: hypothetical protein MUC50_17770 [Myxococcota bacterium]|jgi:RNA polymerase sigma-70 factor (ECF subfamily)|nr:hypothetical protein [Myxococcota bacterium]